MPVSPLDVDSGTTTNIIPIQILTQIADASPPVRGPIFRIRVPLTDRSVLQLNPTFWIDDVFVRLFLLASEEELLNLDTLNLSDVR